MTSAIKPKLTLNVLDYKWGVVPPQDIPGQMTRSMLEMRKPKAYEMKERPPLPAHKHGRRVSDELRIPLCPIVQHSIELRMYIRQANSLVSKLENKSYAVYGQANQIADLSTPPSFEPHTSKCSSSSAKRDKERGGALFAAPELENRFRDGKAEFSSYSISDSDAMTLLKESTQALINHAGYDEINSSSLNLLTGVARKFMVNFSKHLRDALDREAETGHPPFYDVLDGVLNDSGMKSLKELQFFWNSRVVGRHEKLQKQADALSKEVQSLSYRMGEVDMDTVQLSNRYGKWTPVAGMRSGTASEHRSDTTASNKIEHLIKAEHLDYNYSEMSDPFRLERKPTQDNPFEFDDNVGGAFELNEFDYHRTPRKKSRNAL